MTKRNVFIGLETDSLISKVYPRCVKNPQNLYIKSHVIMTPEHF